MDFVYFTVFVKKSYNYKLLKNIVILLKYVYGLKFIYKLGVYI